MAQMLRLRIALYRHIPSGAVAKCFQLPIFFSFSFVFFRFSGQVLNFLFRHSLSFFFFFFFSWVFWAGTEFFFKNHSLSFFFFFFFGVFWAGAEFYILQFFSHFPIFPHFFPIFPIFPPFFPIFFTTIQFHSIFPLLLIFKIP